MPKEKYRIETDDGSVYEIETDDAQSQQPAAVAAAPQQQSYPEMAGQFATDALQGLKAGALSTIYHGGDLVRRGTEAVVGPEWAARLGMENKLDKPEVRSVITPPESTAGQLGYGAEKMGEFFIPAGAVGKAAKAVEGATAGMRGAGALNLAARAGLEGAAAGGVAGVQTAGDPNAMREAALTAGGVTAGLGAVGMAARPVADLLKRSALTQYGRVLNPTKQATKYLSQTQVAPGLLERGVMAGSMKTLQGKAGAQVQKWGQAISDAWSNVPAGTSIELGPVMNNLDQSLDDLFVTTSRGKAPKGPFAEQAAQNVDKLKQTLSDVAEVNPATGVPEIPVDRLREMRQYFDDIAAQAGRYDGKTLAEKSMAEAHGRAADAIREELAQQFPDIAKINKEYNFWKNARQVVDETVLRREGQAKPLGRKLVSAAAAAGGAAQYGPLGVLLGKAAGDQFEALVTGPAWGTVSAVLKDRLANAMAKGNSGEIEFYLRKILGAAGGAKATVPASLQFSPPAKVSSAR
jgi:hypothetical protein